MKYCGQIFTFCPLNCQIRVISILFVLPTLDIWGKVGVCCFVGLLDSHLTGQKTSILWILYFRSLQPFKGLFTAVVFAMEILENVHFVMSLWDLIHLVSLIHPQYVWVWWSSTAPVCMNWCKLVHQTGNKGLKYAFVSSLGNDKLWAAAPLDSTEGETKIRK